MRKSKKKGSSFVVVVFVTAILFTTATTMIAVVTNDYKSRINESKKIENLYQSDSGLDIAYNIIVKNSDTAVVYAKNRVKQDFAATVYKDYDYDKVNKAYKQAFYDFLGTNPYNATNSLKVSDLSDPSDKTDKPLLYGILKKQYATVPTGVTDSVTLADLTTYRNGTWKASTVDTNQNNQIGAIEVESYEPIMDASHNVEKIVIGLKSTFQTDSSSSFGMKNTKTIHTKFTINAPDYDQVAGNNDKVSNVNDYSVTKAITADGDLSVSNGNTSVNGDIWIMGTNKNMENYSYDKYQKGISVDNAHFDVTGDVSTYSTYNLKNSAESIISKDNGNKGNLYARNAYIGPIVNGATSSDNNLTISSSLVTKNDLALNSTNSKVTLNNYYGVSDKKETDTQAESKQEAAEQSSSIIVNKVDSNSTLSAKNAFVHGVAYIDTEGSAVDGADRYQTGESLGVKGNYVAYTTRLPGSSNDVLIKNYKSFDLLDFKDDATNTATEKKTKQFVDYFNQSKDIKDGGINITNLYAVGAGVNSSTITNSNWKNEFDAENGVVYKQQEAFARNVYSMGDTNQTTGAAIDLFNNNGANMLTVGHQNAQIDFDKMKDALRSHDNSYIAARVSNENYGKLVLNCDESRDITISGTKIKYNNNEYEMGDNGQIEAIIVTNGNVNITGNVKFEGSIIAKGNVTITGDNKITYSNLTVQHTIAKYATTTGVAPDYVGNLLANKLFKGQPLSMTASTVTSSVLVDLPGDENGAYDASKYLKKGLWKLDKETGEVIEKN